MPAGEGSGDYGGAEAFSDDLILKPRLICQPAIIRGFLLRCAIRNTWNIGLLSTEVLSMVKERQSQIEEELCAERRERARFRVRENRRKWRRIAWKIRK